MALLDVEVTQWDGADAELFERNEAPDAPKRAFNAMVRYELPLNNGTILVTADHGQSAQLITEKACCGR